MGKNYDEGFQSLLGFIERESPRDRALMLLNTFNPFWDLSQPVSVSDDDVDIFFQSLLGFIKDNTIEKIEGEIEAFNPFWDLSME